MRVILFWLWTGYFDRLMACLLILSNRQCHSHFKSKADPNSGIRMSRSEKMAAGCTSCLVCSYRHLCPPDPLPFLFGILHPHLAKRSWKVPEDDSIFSKVLLCLPKLSQRHKFNKCPWLNPTKSLFFTRIWIPGIPTTREHCLRYQVGGLSCFQIEMFLREYSILLRDINPVPKP